MSRTAAPLSVLSAVLLLSAAVASAAPPDRAAAVARAQALLAHAPHAAAVAAGDAFAARDVIVDPDGAEHVRLDRTWRGLPVLGGDVVIHADAAGRLVGASGTLRSALRPARAAALSLADAVRVATAAFPHIPVGDATAERVVFARGDVPTLAYEAVVYGVRLDGTPSEWHAVVDAATGAILQSFDGIENSAAAGTGRALYVGTVPLTTDFGGTSYALRDPTRGNQYTIDMNNRKSGGTLFTDADNLWGDGTTANRQTVAVDAQFGTSVTWDYFLQVHGRNGIANDGLGAYNRVHYSRRYNNAFWSDSCFCMTYGDGDGTTFGPFVALDVAGHEMSHGVTSRTAALVYSGESGGLSEATSDIFGSMVEFYADNAYDTPDYKIGEKLYLSNPGELKAIRYMWQPSLDGRSPDCWSSTLASLDVHYSSGVGNHFFYLLAEGSGATPASPTCDGSAIAGIGRGAAERIWYRALAVYMTSGTTYAGARAATLQAAADLFGAGSAQAATVAAAWSAVSVY